MVDNGKSTTDRGFLLGFFEMINSGFLRLKGRLGHRGARTWATRALNCTVAPINAQSIVFGHINGCPFFSHLAPDWAWPFGEMHRARSSNYVTRSDIGWFEEFWAFGHDSTYVLFSLDQILTLHDAGNHKILTYKYVRLNMIFLKFSTSHVNMW